MSKNKKTKHSSYGIVVGGPDKITRKEIVEDMVRLMEVGYLSHMPGNTVEKAMDVYCKAVEVKNISISNCTIKMDKNV